MQNLQAADTLERAAKVGRPHVCFVTLEFPLLSETFVIDQVLAQQARGFDVHVVADRIWQADNALSANADLVQLVEGKASPRWPEMIRRMLARLPVRIRRALVAAADTACDKQLNRFDVIVTHFGTTGRRVARSRRLGRFDRPFATIFHGRDVAIPLKTGTLHRYRPLFEQCDLLLPVSDYFGRLLIEAGADPAKVRTHRTGVDCEAIPYAPRDPGPVLQITSAARLMEKKGIEFALRALADLASRRPDIAWRYEVIGDGPLRPRLESLKDGLGLGDRVSFEGAQPHAVVKQRLAQSDVFLLPSVTAADGDVEGVPVALMEAMAAGLPVVSSIHSGIPELVQSGVTGLLAPERDAIQLSRHVEWIAENPEGRRAMSDAARAFVVREFNQQALNDRLADMLVSLARTRRD